MNDDVKNNKSSLISYVIYHCLVLIFVFVFLLETHSYFVKCHAQCVMFLFP